MGLNVKDKPYSELGKVLDGLARSRDVRGPYNIAQHLKGATGYDVRGQAVSEYLHGEYLPKHAFVRAFADAFELTQEERGKLARAYAYGCRSPAWPGARAYGSRTPLLSVREELPRASREDDR
jgi:hypothetical protein